MNVAIYQAGWFGCVFAAAAGRPALAMTSALIPIAIHLFLAPDRGREAQLALFTGALGLVVDTITVQGGIFRFPAALGPSGIAPLWIIALWVQFGMTFHYCFSWLSRRYWLSAALGAVGGPLSFLGGARLGAVEILTPAVGNLALLALLWGVAMPVMVAAADKLAPRRGGPGMYRFELDSDEGVLR